MKQKVLQMMFAALVCAGAQAQVNSGSNGSDGALDFSSMTNLLYSTNIVINMADHPTGIYEYTYVNIPNTVTVSFIPNANNTPVYWLAQNGVAINGSVNVSGQNTSNAQGSLGGPGGYKGGNGAGNNSPPSAGQGPGGGSAGGSGNYNYGNSFLIPLLGGSGGGGGSGGVGGGGGGGAILIASSTSITVNGGIIANGSQSCVVYVGCGSVGSGGAVRLVASQIAGNGYVQCNGGSLGRVRFDTYDNEFSGYIYGQFTSGFQPIIIPTSGQLPQLTITSVGGVPVSTSPTGVLSTPDAVISAQQSSPMPVVVNCANLPLGTAITVTIKPMTSSAVSAVGANNTGTLASSTATISINIPRGGGLIYATAATGN